MRHFCVRDGDKGSDRDAALAVAPLAGGVVHTPLEGSLIVTSGKSLVLAPGQTRTAASAVTLASVAVAADHNLSATAGTTIASSREFHRPFKGQWVSTGPARE